MNDEIYSGEIIPPENSMYVITSPGLVIRTPDNAELYKNEIPFEIHDGDIVVGPYFRDDLLKCYIAGGVGLFSGCVEAYIGRRIVLTDISIMYTKKDGNCRQGTIDHVNIFEKEKFQSSDIHVGDNVQFTARTYIYRRGDGTTDLGLKECEGIKKIKDYFIPTFDDVITQEAEETICNTCPYKDSCYGLCSMNQEEKNNLIRACKDEIINHKREILWEKNGFDWNTVTGYKVVRNSKIFPYEDKKKIVPCCTLDENSKQETVKTLNNNREEAFEIFKAYKSEASFVYKRKFKLAEFNKKLTAYNSGTCFPVLTPNNVLIKVSEYVLCLSGADDIGCYELPIEISDFIVEDIAKINGWNIFDFEGKQYAAVEMAEEDKVIHAVPIDSSIDSRNGMVSGIKAGIYKIDDEQTQVFARNKDAKLPFIPMSTQQKAMEGKYVIVKHTVQCRTCDAWRLDEGYAEKYGDAIPLEGFATEAESIRAFHEYNSEIKKEGNDLIITEYTLESLNGLLKNAVMAKSKYSKYDFIKNAGFRVVMAGWKNYGVIAENDGPYTGAITLTLISAKGHFKKTVTECRKITVPVKEYNDKKRTDFNDYPIGKNEPCMINMFGLFEM